MPPAQDRGGAPAHVRFTEEKTRKAISPWSLHPAALGQLSPSIPRAGAEQSVWLG